MQCRPQGRTVGGIQHLAVEKDRSLKRIGREIHVDAPWMADPNA